MDWAANAEPLHDAMKRIGMKVEYRPSAARSAHQPTGLVEHPQDMLPLNTFQRGRSVRLIGYFMVAGIVIRFDRQ